MVGEGGLGRGKRNELGGQLFGALFKGNFLLRGFPLEARPLFEMRIERGRI
jgi:hypothetical protein